MCLILQEKRKAKLFGPSSHLPPKAGPTLHTSLISFLGIYWGSTLGFCLFWQLLGKSPDKQQGWPHLVLLVLPIKPLCFAPFAQTHLLPVSVQQADGQGGRSPKGPGRGLDAVGTGLPGINVFVGRRLLIGQRVAVGVGGIELGVHGRIPRQLDGRVPATVYLHPSLVEDVEDADVDVGDGLEGAIAPRRQIRVLAGEDRALTLALRPSPATRAAAAAATATSPAAGSPPSPPTAARKALLLSAAPPSAQPSVLRRFVVLDQEQVEQPQQALEGVEDGGDDQAALIVPQLLAAQQQRRPQAVGASRRPRPSRRPSSSSSPPNL